MHTSTPVYILHICEHKFISGQHARQHGRLEITWALRLNIFQVSSLTSYMNLGKSLGPHMPQNLHLIGIIKIYLVGL